MSDDRFKTGREPQKEMNGPGEETHYESGGGRRAAKQRGGARGVLEMLLIAVVAFALVFLVVRPFVVEAFVIPSESMVPTLQVGDRVLANKFIYRFTEPERGDVVVFESVEAENQDLIKRVVATPGDTVAVRDSTLYVNGEPQQEGYVNQQSNGLSPPHVRSEVPEDSYFMMGDNRGNSRDSRFFGAVPEENLEGDAFVIFWPLTRMETL